MFNIERNGDRTILAVWTDLDIRTYASFDGVLRAAAATTEGRIIVSLERCQYCDSKGLDVLLRAAKTLGSRLTVVVPPDNVSRRVFEVCRIPQLMSVVGSMREALGESQDVARPARPRRRYLVKRANQSSMTWSLSTR